MCTLVYFESLSSITKEGENLRSSFETEKEMGFGYFDQIQSATRNTHKWTEPTVWNNLKSLQKESSQRSNRTSSVCNTLIGT